jgi:hypothetical protein
VVVRNGVHNLKFVTEAHESGSIAEFDCECAIVIALTVAETVTVFVESDPRHHHQIAGHQANRGPVIPGLQHAERARAKVFPALYGEEFEPERVCSARQEGSTGLLDDCVEQEPRGKLVG